MICYCIFTRRPEKEHATEFAGLEDENGRVVEAERGIAWTPHPTALGRWRLGPFYVPDRATSEVPRPDLL